MSRLPTLIPIEFRYHTENKYTIKGISQYLGLEVTETSETPVYYHFKRVYYKGTWYMGLYYTVFCELNPEFNMQYKTKMDTERIVILFSEIDYKPVWVYFGCHTTDFIKFRDGFWKRWEECEKTGENGKTLVVYVSSSSHQFYPSPGVWLKVNGVGVDKTGNASNWICVEADVQDARMQSWSTTHTEIIPGVKTPLQIADPPKRLLLPGEVYITAPAKY